MVNRADNELWIVNADGTHPRLGADAHGAGWFPGCGRFILFESDRSGTTELMRTGQMFRDWPPARRGERRVRRMENLSTMVPSEVARDPETLDRMVQRADAIMYEAKRTKKSHLEPAKFHEEAADESILLAG